MMTVLRSFLRRCSIPGLAAGVVAIACAAVPAVQHAVLTDPVQTPTQPSAFAAKGSTGAVARRGPRLVAVGARGLILVSSDDAATWHQVTSPVSTDLVAVKFVDDRTVWAVGHDAVALRSLDGGQSWQKMLDGRSVIALLRQSYGERAKAGDDVAIKMVKEIERTMSQSATPDVLPEPFLDVWFADADEGFLVGAFGIVLHTTDGGKQWQPWIDRLDNDRRYHLYAVTGQGAQRYIAGEQGLLLQFDAASQRFVKVETPYNGTFFGLDLQAGRLLAFGLRGNAYARADGSSDWVKIETGVDDNLVAAVDLPPASAGSADSRLVLVSQGGDLLSVAPDFHKATPLPLPHRGEVLGAVAGAGGTLVLAQTNGISTQAVAPSAH
ncbi:MAG: hypothetical protein JWQ11_2760 [Rhizobacter sp.]|nr:hypothetical protein [Rhizobacter sp.]